MSEEPKRKWERWPPGLRQQAVERMQRGEKQGALLYCWKQRAEGRRKPPEAGAGEDPRDRRVRELEQKVAELEGVIGRKTLEEDFFAGALRRIEETRQRRSSSGGTASTPRSAGGGNRKAD